MTWVKLSDTFAEDPRWDALGADALALHVAALCYCNRLLTDGLISRSKVERLFIVEDAHAAVDALIAADFWRLNGTDIEIVDYLAHQPSSEKVKHDRALSADRQARWLATRKTGRDASHNASYNAVSDGNPAPSRPAPKGSGRDGTDSLARARSVPTRPTGGLAITVRETTT